MRPQNAPSITVPTNTPGPEGLAWPSNSPSMNKAASSTSIRTCRCCGRSAITCSSPAPSSAAAWRCAAPAPCTSMASRRARASRRCRRSQGRQCHDHRGPRDAGRQGGAGRLDRPRRAAVRLLPERPDHVGRGAAGDEPEAERCRHRRRPWRATSAAARPTCASATPSTRPRTRSPRTPSRLNADKERTCTCVTSTDATAWPAGALAIGAHAPAVPEADDARRLGAHPRHTPARLRPGVRDGCGRRRYPRCRCPSCASTRTTR